jgi:hypothetical protein
VAGAWTSTVDVAANSSASSSDRNAYMGASGNLQYLYDGRVYKIAEFVLGIVTASVTFTSIPGTYRHLILEWQARGDTAATNIALQLQFNADTGANYDFANGNINGSGTANGGGSQAGATLIQVCDMAAATAPALTPSHGRIDFQNYAGTTFHKTLTAHSGLKQSAAVANLFNETTVAWWRSAAAITSIKLVPGAGNFVAGGSFQLYGLN